MVAGGQKIFARARLSSDGTFYSEATRTMTGGFLPMMFGLLAAALLRTAVQMTRIKPK